MKVKNTFLFFCSYFVIRGFAVLYVSKYLNLTKKNQICSFSFKHLQLFNEALCFKHVIDPDIVHFCGCSTKPVHVCMKISVFKPADHKSALWNKAGSLIRWKSGGFVQIPTGT